MNRQMYYLNLSRPQAIFGQFDSSSPFAQSGKPSHTYDFEMHRPESHKNWFFKHLSISVGSLIDGVGIVPVAFVQPISSESSPQSLTPSHFLFVRTENLGNAYHCWPAIYWESSSDTHHQYGTHLSFSHWYIQSWHVGIMFSILVFGSDVVWVQLASSAPFIQSWSPSKRE